MARVKQNVTDEQRTVVKNISVNNEGFIDDYEDEPELIIPEVFRNTNTGQIDTNEIEKAILNNVPGNAEVEEINHLNELEEVCQNWKEKEWERILFHAASHLMTKELDRRLEYSEKFIANNRANLELLASQKL